MRFTLVPEGGELCLTACGVTEGNGTCGKSKPTHPSSKRANSRLPFALFEDDAISHIYTASSASLHMRLSIVGPLRGPMYVIALAPKLRMNPFCNTVSNAMFCICCFFCFILMIKALFDSCQLPCFKYFFISLQMPICAMYGDVTATGSTSV